MNDRTRWDANRQARSQQGGWNEPGEQYRQQHKGGGQQGGWNDDPRTERGAHEARRRRDHQPQQFAERGANAQPGGDTGAPGMGWSAQEEDIGARGRDAWNRRDEWRASGSQSFASDYGMRSGGADYDRPVQRRSGYAGSANPQAYGRGYGPDYGHDDGNDRGFLARAGDEIASWFGDDDAAQRREQDYRGQGPADYTRSDERIREDVNDRLTDDWRIDARRISVLVDKGEVTLNGTVASREAKRRAEDCIDRISGVKHVQNNLRVEQPGSTPTAGTKPA